MANCDGGVPGEGGSGPAELQDGPARVLASAVRQARGKAGKSAPGAIGRAGADLPAGPIHRNTGVSRWGQKEKGKMKKEKGKRKKGRVRRRPS